MLALRFGADGPESRLESRFIRHGSWCYVRRRKAVDLDVTNASLSLGLLAPCLVSRLGDT